MGPPVTTDAGNSILTCLPYLQLGDACDGYGECDFGLNCDNATQTCVARIALGSCK